MQFKTGDIVEVVSKESATNSLPPLCLNMGEKYTIQSCTGLMSDLERHDSCECAHNNNWCGGWFTERFQLAKKVYISNSIQAWKNRFSEIIE